MKKLTLFFVPSLFATGCAGSETGNGAREEVPVKVEMKLVAAPSGTYVALDASGAVFELDGASALVDRIDFVLPEDGRCRDDDDDDGDDDNPTVAPYEAYCDGSSGRVRVDGPWEIDLVTGAMDPPLDALMLPLGQVERVEVRMLPGTSRDWTLVAHGFFGDRDFRLELRFADIVRFEGGQAAAIVESTMLVVLGVDPSTWFAELDLAGCIAGGHVPTVDGVLRLDQGSPARCGNVEAEVRKAILATTRLAIDR